MSVISNIPRIDINLDLAPEERYRELISLFDIPKISIKLEELYEQYLPQIPCLDSILSVLIQLNKCRVKYADEIDYWSNVFGVPFHKALLMQLLYELNSGCTTFSAKLDGKNVMIRTFDWPELFLKKLLYQATFYKDGRKIYEAVCILGGIGIFTGKTKDYSVAINYRRTHNPNMLRNLWNLVKGYWPVSYLLRDVLENRYNGKEAVQILRNSPLISPVYFSVNLFGDNPYLIVRDPTSSQEFNEEYTIQTNCDHFKIENNEDLEDIHEVHPPLEDIEYSVDRYLLVKKVLNKEDSLERVLKGIFKFPVIRDDTLFISVISEDTFDTEVLKDVKIQTKKSIYKMYSSRQNNLKLE